MFCFWGGGGKNRSAGGLEREEEEEGRKKKEKNASNNGTNLTEDVAAREPSADGPSRDVGHAHGLELAVKVQGPLGGGGDGGDVEAAVTGFFFPREKRLRIF